MACHLTFRISEAVYNWCEGKTLAKCLLWHDRFSWRFTPCSKGRSPLFQKARETFLPRELRGPQRRMTWENFSLFPNLYFQRALWSQLQQWNIQKQLTLRLKYLMRKQESRYVLWIRWVCLFKCLFSATMMMHL